MKTVVVILDSEFMKSVELLAGINAVFSETGEVRVAPLRYSQVELFETLLSGGTVSGVVGSFIGDRWLERFVRSGIPFVNVGTASEISLVPSVLPDFRAAGRLAAEHFAEGGRKELCVVCERAQHASAEIAAGVHMAAEKLGLPVSMFYTDCTAISFETERLDNMPPETGCVCASDFYARRLIAGLLERGIGVPEKVGVVGVGDSTLESALSAVPLSSVPIPYREVGERAARKILRAGREDFGGTEYVAPGRLAVRESSVQFKYADGVVVRAVRYMMENLFERGGVGDLARFCGVSRRNLEMRYRTSVGMSPGEDWNRRRHAEVCRLLRETDIPLRRVAEMSGFSEMPSFWSAFRKAEGVSPMVYRRAHRKTCGR